RDREAVERLVGAHQNRPVGAHREARAQLLLPGLLADRDQRDIAAALLLLDSQRLLDGDFVEGVNHPFHVVSCDSRAVRQDTDGGGRVRDTFYGSQDFHGNLTPGVFSRAFLRWWLTGAARV